MKKQMRAMSLLSSALIIAGSAGMAHAAWDTSGGVVTVPPGSESAVDATIDLYTSLAASDPTDPLVVAVDGAAGDPVAMQRIIDEITPTSVSGGMAGGIQASGGAASGSVMGRMASIRNEQIFAKLSQQPEGPAGTTTKDNVFMRGRALTEAGVWGKALVASGDQDEIDNIDGYDYDSIGLMFGYDTYVREQLLMGVNIGYIETDVDSGVNTDQDVESIAAGIYGTWSPSDIYVDFGFSYNSGDIDYDRSVAGTKIQGDTDSDTYIVYTNTGYNVFLSDTWVVTPEVGVLYSHSDIDGYSETGGSAALDIDDGTINLFSSNLVVKSELLVTDSWNFKAKLAWNHEFRDDNQSSTSARYVSSGANAAFFTTDGIEVDDDKFLVGLGSKFYFSESLYLDVEYTYEFADEFDAHIGDVSMKYSF